MSYTDDINEILVQTLKFASRIVKNGCWDVTVVRPHISHQSMVSRKYICRDILWQFSEVFIYFGHSKQKNKVSTIKSWFLRKNEKKAKNVGMLLCPSNSNIPTADSVLDYLYTLM